MKLREIQRLLQAEVVWGTEAHLNSDIDSACSSDLMSDVLAFGRPGQLLLTGLSNAQSVRTADILEAKAIVYVRGKWPDEEGLELATRTSTSATRTQSTVKNTPSTQGTSELSSTASRSMTLKSSNSSSMISTKG